MDETLGFNVGDKVIALVPVECEVIGWSLPTEEETPFDEAEYTISCTINGKPRVFTAYNRDDWLSLEAFNTVGIVQKAEDA